MNEINGFEGLALQAVDGLLIARNLLNALVAEGAIAASHEEAVVLASAMITSGLKALTLRGMELNQENNW